MRRAALLAALLACLLTRLALAQDADLDRIPEALQPGSLEPVRSHGRYALEEVPAAAGRRSDLAVPFPSPVASWTNRLSLDALDAWHLGDRVTLTFSDRANAIAESDFAFLSRQSLRNDLREAYATWEPAPERFVEAGRINLRNGVALGYNPTDFCKPRSAIGTASLDPTVIRENRLGSAMLRGQALWDGGSAMLALAPKLAAPSPLGATRMGFDPRFDRTNGSERALLALSLDIADLAPQALLFREAGETRAGLNLSHGIGQSVVAYAEWAGGRQADLIAQALRFGKATGSFPAAFAGPLAGDASRRFRNDLSLGASWTSAAKITVTLEYHYHQAGFSRADWRNWFDTGSRQASLAAPLWFIRGFAADQQQPVTREQAFIRAVWTDAFVDDLELGAFAVVDLYDGSSLAQLSASYFLSKDWTIGAYVAANLGGRRSEHGSLPQATSATLRLVRYF